jgi:hypothetical protein
MDSQFFTRDNNTGWVCPMWSPKASLDHPKNLLGFWTWLGLQLGPQRAFGYLLKGIENAGLRFLHSYEGPRSFLGPFRNHVQRARWQFLIGFYIEIKLEFIVTTQSIVDTVFPWILELGWIVLRAIYLVAVLYMSLYPSLYII